MWKKKQLEKPQNGKKDEKKNKGLIDSDVEWKFMVKLLS